MAQQEAPWFAKVVILATAGGALAYAIAHHGEPARSTASPSAEAAPCSLSVRAAQQGPYMFPTKAGLEQWDDAVMARASAEDLRLVLMRNLATQTEWRSSCEVLDSGISHSRVRVTSGTMAGAEGWVPTSQTLGN